MSKPTVVYDQTMCHRLTVVRDGKVRIKIAKGASDEETQRIIAGFTKVARLVKKANMLLGTLRGAVKLGDTHNTITLYTDSKKQYVSFKY